jgi:hypothetical protein
MVSVAPTFQPLRRDGRGRKPSLTYATVLEIVEELKDPRHSKLFIAMSHSTSRETVGKIHNSTPDELRERYDRGACVV